MSSPAGVPQSQTPWQTTPPLGVPIAPAPAPPAAAAAAAPSNEDGVVVKSMRLKVLYTFDDQNKTNCLARWPDILQIKTVSLDDTSSIGIIELKTCLKAIIQCSPELMAKLGPDYTIYAYDYSEYDTPLVGQGMLSKVLAAASPTPVAPAMESGQMITGRVCKNILGIFANGVKETLEVKLRLVPVPKVVEDQYRDTMESYNRTLPGSQEYNEWNAFMQSNLGMAQMGNRVTPTPSINIHQRDGTSMEVVNQLLSPQIQPQPIADPFNQANLNANAPANGAMEGGAKKTSRPVSRASVKRPRGRKPKAGAGGNTSGYEEGTDGDEGPAPKRKRAKVTKANQQNNNSAFNTAPDSLRVHASTAGSLRMFRPIASSGPVAGPVGAYLQEIPRAPTPVPIMPKQHIARDQAPSQGSLRRDSSVSQNTASQLSRLTPYQFDGSEDQLRNSIESANPSPERSFSPADTPPDIGSSPPVMRTRPATPMRIESSPPCASSPVLPQMPRTDSGFMSGSIEELFGDDEEVFINDDDTEYVDQNETPRPSKRPSPKPLQAEFTIQEVMPGPVELLPTKMPIIEDPAGIESRARAAISRANSIMSEDGQPRKRGRSTIRKNAKPREKKVQQQVPVTALAAAPAASLSSEPWKSISQQSGMPMPEVQISQSAPALSSMPGSRTMVRTASMGSLTLPTIPASDSVLPPSGLQRSQTWSETPHPTTEAPMADYPSQDFIPKSDSSIKFHAKKAAIRQRLEEAIANGQMPPFCSNCGAVDTPTWRKAWSQEHQGEPGYYEYSDKAGCVTAIIVTTRDEEGKPTSYQLIKKALSKQEENTDDFKEFLLCNPCGIWLSKYKHQRPPEKWEFGPPSERASRGGGARRQRVSKPKKLALNAGIPTSEANYPPSEMNFPYSEANFPQSEAYFPRSEAVGPPEATGTMERQETLSPGQPNQERRGSSSRPMKRLKAMTSGAASEALRRAIQSSPARWQGTRNSPIDVEDDLGETRRLLFPSPRKDGSPKVLGEVVANVATITSTPITTDLHSAKEAMVENQNKENCPPAIDDNEMDPELVRMFEEEIVKADIARPTTPVQSPQATNPFKTPTRPTPSHRPVTRSVSRSQQSSKTPRTLLTFEKTPSRTPVRRSPRLHNGVFESPFTATLNQLMSEANNQISPSRDTLELDFGSLPELPQINGQHTNMDMNFSLEDFFSTDVPMPSSPPRMFNLYDENLAMDSVNWSNFGQFATNDQEVAPEIVVKAEPHDSPLKSPRDDNDTADAA